MFGFFKKLLGLPTEAEKAEAAAAPYKVEAPTNKLDINNDGKVNLEDAKEAVKKTKTRAKKAVAEVKEEVKKKAGRKSKTK